MCFKILLFNRYAVLLVANFGLVFIYFSTNILYLNYYAHYYYYYFTYNYVLLLRIIIIPNNSVLGHNVFSQ